MKSLIGRFGHWFNKQSSNRKAVYYSGFCLAFIGLLWLSIHFLRFDAKVYTNAVPKHIGQPSTGPLNSKKH